MFKKRGILLAVFVLGAMVTLSMFCLLGSVGAQTTGTVSPSVTVSSTLSLAIEDGTDVQWGSQAAGTPQTGEIQARVTSNTNWALTVKRTSDTSLICALKGADDIHHIANSNLTYTSVAGAPAPSGSGVTDAQFDTSDTDVWTAGAPLGECRVAVTYDLTIPANQYPQAYSATHLYTLTSTP